MLFSGSVASRIKLLSIPEQIANSMKQSILDGTLKPGQTIPPQKILAEQLGVSRPTVREALQFLIDSQLIEADDNRYGGYRVSKFSSDKATKRIYELIQLSLISESATHQDLFELRRMIELPSASLAARRRTEQELSELKACISEISSDHSTAKDLLQLDMKFHYQLSKCTHNPLLQTLMYAFIMMFEQKPTVSAIEQPENIVKGLPEVVECIENMDSEQAMLAMDMHLMHSRKCLEFPCVE